jgi:hypothetical protein
VKILQVGFTSPPLSLVVVPAKFGRHGAFDPWLTHSAIGDGYLGGNFGASGKIYATFQITLKDGIEYVYISNAFSDVNAFNAFEQACTTWQVPGYPGNWEGEGFNFFYRAAMVNKVAGTDFPAWLAAH